MDKKEHSTRYIFSSIRRKSKKYVMDGFIVWFYSYPRKFVHISISRKVGKAVLRNKIRRIVKNFIRLSSMPTGYYILSARKGCSAASAKLVVNHLSKVLI